MYEDLIEEKVSSEDIFDGVLLHVKRDYVKLPNGNKAVREWIKHQGASAVIPARIRAIPLLRPLRPLLSTPI